MKITLEVSRNFGRETEKIRFVPRISTAELSKAVELARLEKANQIADLIIVENPRSKLVRVSLNEENGRIARIIFEHSQKKQIAALADVSGVAVPENLLTAAILWLAKLENRRKNPVNAVWILAEKKIYKNLRKLHALLAENWKSKITLKEIAAEKTNAPNKEIIERPALTIKTICGAKNRSKFHRRKNRKRVKSAMKSSNSRRKILMRFLPNTAKLFVLQACRLPVSENRRDGKMLVRH